MGSLIWLPGDEGGEGDGGHPGDHGGEVGYGGEDSDPVDDGGHGSAEGTSYHRHVLDLKVNF